MKIEEIEAAELEARRFLARVDDLYLAIKRDGNWVISGTRASGAVYRASMDLSNALAKIRRSA